MIEPYICLYACLLRAWHIMILSDMHILDLYHIVPKEIDHTYLPTYLCIYLSIYLYIYLSIYLSTHSTNFLTQKFLLELTYPIQHIQSPIFSQVALTSPVPTWPMLLGTIGSTINLKESGGEKKDLKNGAQKD